MSTTLLSVCPKLQDLVALTPEDLGGIIVEVVPAQMQNGMFNIDTLYSPLYQLTGPSYPSGTQRSAINVLAEALSWLETQGLIVTVPDQPAPWYRLTRRAATLQTRVDVEAFRKGRILPDDLLPAIFKQKVVPLFRRGDHDVAIFQAFKEVEVSTRKAANTKGAGYPDNYVGVDLMRKAFHPETGPLTNVSLVFSEREAEMHLFSGAMGHAKNPPGHRDFVISAPEAAQLIIFASYLFGIVALRAA